MGRMDQATAYIITRLDRIDRQLGDLLRRQEQRPSLPVTEGEKTGVLSRLNKMPLPMQWILGGVISWGISSAIGSYLIRGGDPVKLLEMLFKLAS